MAGLIEGLLRASRYRWLWRRPHVGLFLAALLIWVALVDIEGRHALASTALFSCLVAGGILLATPWIYWAVERAHRPMGHLAWSVWLCSLFIPLYVQTAGWQAGVGPSGSWAVPAASSRDMWWQGWVAAAWIHWAAALPWAMWIMRMGSNVYDRHTCESALLEATPSLVYRRVSLPWLWPWLMLAAAWAAVWAATELFVADLYLVPTVTRRLYLEFALGQPLAPALTLAGGVVLAGGLTLSLVGSRTWTGARWDALPRRGDWPRREPPGAWASLAVFAVLLTVSFVPLATLVIDAGLRRSVEQGWQWSWSQLVERAAHGAEDFRWEIIGTLTISCFAALAALASVLWLMVLCYGRRAQQVVWAGMLILWLTPGPLIGVLLTHLFRRPELPLLADLYDRTLFAPIAAAYLRILPLVWIACFLGVRQVHAAHWELAALEGVARWRFFLKVVWPQSRPAVLVGTMLGFCWATGELGATLAVIPPGVETVAVRIANLMHTGVRDKEAVLSLYHMLSCLAVAALCWLAIRRADKQGTSVGR